MIKQAIDELTEKIKKYEKDRAILYAFLDGVAIEYINHDTDAVWRPFTKDVRLSCFDRVEFRIAPNQPTQPITLYIPRFPDGSYATFAYACKESCKSFFPNATPVKFKQVVE